MPPVPPQPPHHRSLPAPFLLGLVVHIVPNGLRQFVPRNFPPSGLKHVHPKLIGKVGQKPTAYSGLGVRSLAEQRDAPDRPGQRLCLPPVPRSEQSKLGADSSHSERVAKVLVTRERPTTPPPSRDR